jgi:hypothetical protein
LLELTERHPLLDLLDVLVLDDPFVGQVLRRLRPLDHHSRLVGVLVALRGFGRQQTRFGLLDLVHLLGRMVLD